MSTARAQYNCCPCKYCNDNQPLALMASLSRTDAGGDTMSFTLASACKHSIDNNWSVLLKLHIELWPP